MPKIGGRFPTESRKPPKRLRSTAGTSSDLGRPAALRGQYRALMEERIADHAEGLAAARAPPQSHAQLLPLDSRSSLHISTETATDVDSYAGDSEERDLDDGAPLVKDSPFTPKAEPERTGTPQGSVINLANTVLGAGMLALPKAFEASGYVVGTAVLICAGLCSAASLHLLAVSQQTVGVTPSSFYTVANAAIPRWSWVIDVAVAIKCFGVATGLSFPPQRRPLN